MEIRKFKNLLSADWYKSRFLRHVMNKMDDDIAYLQLKNKLVCGGRLDLENPKTFNEKCNWLKLYDQKEEYTRYVDKAAVKEYVKEKIGEEYVIKTLGVYEHFDDIDFSLLPDRFVMKCTHDSGSVVVVSDKSKMNKAAARKRLEKGLQTDFFLVNREWAYKHCPRRIIVEEYIPGLGALDSVEYKLTAMGGGNKIHYGMRGHSSFCRQEPYQRPLYA